jgi:LytR cell envelope-related transcriptional attenuator
VVIAVVVLVVVLVVGNKSSSSGDHANGATAASHTSKGNHSARHGKGKVTAVDVDPTSVTVSVLNGTMTTNLAADVSNKLTAKGFQAGSTGNAVDQSMPTTVVGYVPSAPHAKNDAYAVAHTLGLKQNAVKPVSSANQTVACSGQTNCPDQVIVTVGADLNSDAT